MSVVSPTWLSLSGEANYIRSTYIDGFLDVSSSRGVLLRSDVSFGQRLMFPTLTTVSPNSTAATALTWVANGVTFTASASTLQGTAWNPNYVFNTGGADWSSAASRYTTSTGVAVTSSPTQTTLQNSVGVVNGEWVQIQSTLSVIMKNFSLLNTNNLTSAPILYYIAGSNDNSTWYPIIKVTMTSSLSAVSTGAGTITIPATSETVTGVTTSAGYGYNYTTYGNSTTSYSYFRIVINSIGTSNDGVGRLAEWNINFTPATSAITLTPSTTTYGQLDLTGGLSTTSNISSFSTQTSSYASPYTALKFTNTNNGAAGASVAMDFSTYDTLSNTPAARISFLDANYSADTIFSSKVPGAITNAMAERMRITGGGNVGIGTASPSAALDVNGGMLCSSVISVHGDVTLSVGDAGKLIVCHGGDNGTVTLPAVPIPGSIFRVVERKQYAKTVTISANGKTFIGVAHFRNGTTGVKNTGTLSVTSDSLAWLAGNMIEVIYDGAYWVILKSMGFA